MNNSSTSMHRTSAKGAYSVPIAKILLVLELMLIAMDRFRPATAILLLLTPTVGLILMQKPKIWIGKTATLNIFLVVGTIVIGMLSAVVYHSEGFYAVKGGIRYTAPLFLYVIVSNCRSMSFRAFSTMIKWLTVIALTITAIQIMLGQYRPSAMFEHRNPLAYFLAVANIVLLVRYKVSQKQADLILPALMPIAIIALSSLGGLISYLVSTALFLFTTFGSKGKILLLLVLPLFITLCAIAISPRLEQLYDLSELQARIDVDNSGGGSSMLWRLVTWHRMLTSTIEKNRWLTGQGLESTSRVSPFFILPDAFRNDPHNDYVRVFVECGASGLLLLLIAIGKSLHSIRKMLKKTNNSDYQTLYLLRGLLSILFALLICMLVANILPFAPVTWMIATMAGIAFSRWDKHVGGQNQAGIKYVDLGSKYGT